MTRQAVLTLIAGAPFAAFVGRKCSTIARHDDLVHLRPSTYAIAAGGRIWLSSSSVRIEGCTFHAVTVVKPIDWQT